MPRTLFLPLPGAPRRTVMLKVPPRRSMPAPSRREQAREAARLRILEEARKLFLEKGYDAVTMRDVAKATGYTASALYYHFPDKADLLGTICREDFLNLATLFQSVLVHPNPLDNIQAMGRADAKFAFEHPNHYRRMFMARVPVEPNEEDQARMGDPAQDAYAALHHFVAQAHAQGLLREGMDDTHLMAQTFWSGIHGMVSLELDKGCEKWLPWSDLQRRIDHMCSTLRLGMARP